MNNQEYIIINKTTLLKRLAELEKEKASNLTQNLVGLANQNEGEIRALKRMLTQSVDLMSEIEKAFDAGCAYTVGSHQDFKQTHPSKQEYISNLKLDI